MSQDHYPEVSTGPNTDPQVMGMHRDVAKIIAEMSILDLERIAKNEVNELLPRWADLSSAWRDLLQAAQGNESHTSQFVALHALQLVTSEQACAAGAYK